MEWLRVQLQFMRERGMKAILSGHVPPARTENKANWDETCWQKYALWLRQYRDVVVGSMYGHMNVDHFILQDSRQVNIRALKHENQDHGSLQGLLDTDLSAQSAADYLIDLRESWSRLPEPPKGLLLDEQEQGHIQMRNRKRRHDERSKKRYLKKIGGQWAERYAVSQVSPSVIPNYFPSLRVFEYNITGLGDLHLGDIQRASWDSASRANSIEYCSNHRETDDSDGIEKEGSWTWHRRKRCNPNIPKAPSKSTPPGPAYSPQTFTLLGFTQYFANLTHINNDFGADEEAHPTRWHAGKHTGKDPSRSGSKPKPRKFTFQVEYSTFDDKVYKLRDLTVRSYLQLAQRIGSFKPRHENQRAMDGLKTDEQTENTMEQLDRANKLHQQPLPNYATDRHKKDKRTASEVWITFLRRAFVGAIDDEDLREEVGSADGVSREFASDYKADEL